MYRNVVSCLANVLLHIYNDVAQTGGGWIMLWWSRRQSAAVSAVMMCFVISFLSACCHSHFILANFAYHFICLFTPSFIPVSIFYSLPSDRANDDRAGDCCEPACGGMGGNPGVWDHPTAHVWPRLDWHEEPGQQLLPQLCHASALHCSRLPEQVSTLFYSQSPSSLLSSCQCSLWWKMDSNEILLSSS